MSTSNNPPSEPAEEWLIAMVGLTITNAPGTIPSVTKLARGERFQFDGDESVYVDRLFKAGAIQVYNGSTEQEALRADQLVEVVKKKNNPLTRKARARRASN